MNKVLSCLITVNGTINRFKWCLKSLQILSITQFNNSLALSHVQIVDSKNSNLSISGLLLRFQIENATVMTSFDIEIKCTTFWLMFELIATLAFITFVIGYVILGRHLHKKCIKGSTVMVSGLKCYIYHSSFVGN